MGAVGRYLEGPCFNLFTNPSFTFASLWWPALCILAACKLPEAPQGRISSSASFISLDPLPSPPLASLPFPPLLFKYQSAPSGVQYHFIPLIPKLLHASVCGYSVPLSPSPHYPHSHLCFHSPPPVSTLLLKYGRRPGRRSAHCDPQKTSWWRFRFLKHTWERVSTQDGLQPWDSGAWKCWGRSNTLHE